MYTQYEDYEWDDNKRRLNVAKHGIDFGAVRDFQWRAARTTSHIRHGETRYLSIGYLYERLHVVVYTLRGRRVRIISLRRASRLERQSYVE